jgi:hypothetical protein
VYCKRLPPPAVSFAQFDAHAQSSFAASQLLMPNESAKPEATFGYLSMLEFVDHGYFGGYLIVSVLGRPLEFHCTAPVRPSHAQRILYGPTLEPYLLGEQIAGSLLDVAKLTPSLILSNREATLHARPRAGAPMAWLIEKQEQSESLSHPDCSNKRDASSAFCRSEIDAISARRTFHAGVHELQLPLGYESEQDIVCRLLLELSQQVEIAEPFGRIEEAIREAQRLGGRGAEANDQAA